MKDNYGDTIVVSHALDYSEETDGIETVVSIEFFTEENEAAMHLTPEKARKLAKKLRRLADEIEGVE